MGVILLKVFNVTRQDYSNLANVTLIKTLSRFLPILLIPFLVPNASPHDEILTTAEKLMGPREMDDLGAIPVGGDRSPDRGRSKVGF